MRASSIDGVVICLLVGLGLVGCSSDGSESTSGALADAGADAAANAGAGQGGSASPNAGGTPGRGGSSSSSGGADRGGASSGDGGGASCPPECFVANECVTACGEEPRNHGCCPCPSGTINVFSCGTRDGGSARVVCDPRLITCRRAPPVCPDGQVPSVDGSCYGPCVPADACPCSGPEECPEPNSFTCHLSAGNCGPYVR